MLLVCPAQALPLSIEPVSTFLSGHLAGFIGGLKTLEPRKKVLMIHGRSAAIISYDSGFRSSEYSQQFAC